MSQDETPKHLSVDEFYAAVKKGCEEGHHPLTPIYPLRCACGAVDLSAEYERQRNLPKVGETLCPHGSNRPLECKLCQESK